MRNPISRVVGIDPGATYMAWSVINLRRGRSGRAIKDWELERHGLLAVPDIGKDAWWGHRVMSWSIAAAEMLQLFEADVVGVERYTHRAIGGGQNSEVVNIHIGALGCRMPVLLFRNTDWKSWLKRVHNGAEASDVWPTSTPHESDATGIAHYTAIVAAGKRSLKDEFGRKTTSKRSS